MRNQLRTLKYLPCIFIIITISFFVLNMFLFAKTLDTFLLVLPLVGLILWPIEALIYKKYFKIFKYKIGVNLKGCDYRIFTDFTYKLVFYLILIASSLLLVLALIFGGIYPLIALTSNSLNIELRICFSCIIIEYSLPIITTLCLLVLENRKNRQYLFQKEKELLEK